LTQGIHVASGIASVPVLIAKLWVVWPRFVALPPVKRASYLVERVSLFPLVGGGIFMVFSGHLPAGPDPALAPTTPG